MPELPEVETAKLKLQPLLVGKRILDLEKKKILKIERRGKAILLYLSGGKVLAFHQKMSGKLLVTDRDFSDKYIRFRFRLSSGKDLIFHDVRRFGIKWYGEIEKVLKEKYFSTLGPDPLMINFDKFHDLFKEHKGGIKHLLLRQDIISGVGNIIADESLWKAGIHPMKNVDEIKKKDFKKLYESLRFILNKSIALGGSSMRDWVQPDKSKGGYFPKRLVYARKGEKCRRCGKIIIRMKAAGRGTFICKKCQKLK